MHETLNETLKTMDKKVAKTVETAIVRLETAVTNPNGPNYNEITAAVSVAKDIGTALKTLAEGLESYRAVASAIKTDASLEP